MRTARLNDRIEALRRQMRELQSMARQVETAPDRQISLTDPDAHAMATIGKGTGLVGYNVQAAVDADSHIVVAHDVTNTGHDRTQLADMGRQAKDATGAEHLTVLADRGHFSDAEVLACEEAGVIPICPKPLTSGAAARYQARDTPCRSAAASIWAFMASSLSIAAPAIRHAAMARCSSSVSPSQSSRAIGNNWLSTTMSRIGPTIAASTGLAAKSTTRSWKRASDAAIAGTSRRARADVMA